MREFDYIKLIKSLWALVAAFISAVTLIVQFLELWKGDQATVTWVVTGLAFLLLVSLLIWVGFIKYSTPSLAVPPGYHYRQLRYPKFYLLARLLLLVVLVTSLIGAFALAQRLKTLESKLVILVTVFDGPNPQGYRVTDILITNLEDALKSYPDVVLTFVPKSIDPGQGHYFARSLGRRYRADYVFWGWYGVTSTSVLVNFHVENLHPSSYLPLNVSELSQLRTTIADIENFSLQLNLASQATALIKMIVGIRFYEVKDYKNAINIFTDAINKSVWSDLIFNQSALYFYRGNSYYFEKEYEHALDDFSRAIEINPELSMAYNNRGAIYSEMEKYELAFSDFSRAIQLDNNALAYRNRAIVRTHLISEEREDEIRSVDFGYYALLSCMLRDIQAVSDSDKAKVVNCYRSVVEVAKTNEVKEIAEDWVRSYGEEP
jgi:tetratricopeptide (TPR) repeat protein